MLGMWEAFRTMRPDLPYITEYTEITFPPGSSLVESYSLGGPDRSITAVVKVRRRDVSRFVSDLRRTTETEDYKRADLLHARSAETKLKWWDPDSAHNLRGFQSTPRHPKGDMARCMVLIREDDPHYALIYIDGFLY
jgi:hypothetical protein